jgi:P-type Ca2+ transporter type 2C
MDNSGLLPTPNATLAGASHDALATNRSLVGDDQDLEQDGISWPDVIDENNRLRATTQRTPSNGAARSPRAQPTTPSALSTFYQTLATPRDSTSSSLHFFPATAGVEKDGLEGDLNNTNQDQDQANRESHRERFLSDAERIVAADPRKTRESFRELEATTTQAEWHDRSIAEVLAIQQTDAKHGLTTDEAVKRLAVHGPNSLEADKKTPVLVIFLLQYMNLIMGLLCVAALASIALQEFVEGFAIFGIVTLNAIVATVQEKNASDALDALQKMSSPQCVVMRDGRQQVIPSEQLVDGDIVVLATGDIVPADIRLVFSSDFKVNEMILTGESEDVLKKYDAVMSKPESGKAEKLTASNMVFSSTSVATGNAVGVVVETGMGTRVGSIAALLKGSSLTKDGKKKNFVQRFMEKYQPKMTPLQHSLHRLGVFMGTAVCVVCVVVFVVGMARGNRDPKHPERPIWLYMVMIAVTLAVSAVPEGLPMVVTICLSTGTADMVKQNVLVRKLAAVESLGASSVICTDKTGTLTEGKMTAIKMWGDSLEYAITGAGFDPVGEILHNGVSQTKSNALVRTTLLSATLCSNTSLQKETLEDGRVVWVPMGNSSEAPLVVAAAKAGLWRETVMEDYPRVAEVPFSSTRKMMITVTELSAGKPFGDLHLPYGTQFVANVKGAPNYIVKNCTEYVRTDGSVASLRASDRRDILDAVDSLSSQALRVLAVAIRPLPALPYDSSEEDVDNKFDALCEPLIFVGLIASIDPPRQGVKESIMQARSAGVRTVMITGDYHKTAVAIAQNIDLLGVGANTEEEAVDCNVLRPHGEYIPEHELDEITSRCSVFARAKPEDKIEIVKSLQRQGHVASMTGDGVNDAPALKEADIGVAMGIAGTAVAKGASDMILTDDNFCSIVAAVEKGREIYANIQRFVCFLLSTNFGEITMIFTAIAIGMPNPLEPLQILVLNIFADGMAAVALSLEKGDGTVMLTGPRPRAQQIIHGRLWVLVLFNAFLIALGALIVFTFGLYWNFDKILLNDIMSDVDFDAGPAGYRNAVCKRWMGMSDGWHQVSNCNARTLGGDLRFPPGVPHDDVTCYDGNYDCISEGISRAQTMTFIYITNMELLRAYTARSFTKSVFHQFLANKWMQWAAVGSVILTISVTNIPVIMDDLFGFAYIEWYQWLFSILFSIIMVIFGETMKWIYRRRDRKKLEFQTIEDGFKSALHELHNLRAHVQRVEEKLEVAIETSYVRYAPPADAVAPSSNTSGSSNSSAASSPAFMSPAGKSASDFKLPGRDL